MKIVVLNPTIGKGRDETLSSHATSRNPPVNVPVCARGLMNSWRLWPYFPKKSKVIPKPSVTFSVRDSDHLASLSFAVK
jgi:hypothetical protein